MGKFGKFFGAVGEFTAKNDFKRNRVSVCPFCPKLQQLHDFRHFSGFLEGRGMKGGGQGS